MPNNNPVLWSNPVDPDLCAEVSSEVDHLFSESRREEALHLLESTWPGLPAEALHMSRIDLMVIRAYLQAQVGRESDALETIEAMLRSDVSCNLAGRGFDPLRTLAGYADVAQRNEALLAREREGARVEFDVHLPSDLRPGDAAPLMLVLHSEPGNLMKIRNAWPSDPITARGVIVAYLQSSQLSSTSRYVWSADPAVARSDAQEAFRNLCQRYPIDESRVILGGFSSGATTALDLVFGQVVPAAGFIGLCTGDKPEHFTHENIDAAKARGVRGVFLEGEENWPDDDQQEMLQTMQEAGLPVELMINEGIGHGAPKDFPQKLDRALSFIFGSPID